MAGFLRGSPGIFPNFSVPGFNFSDPGKIVEIGAEGP